MEYTHFSHNHGLIPHQVPQGSQISCSGCESPGTGSIYACWACNFFLHEQCFNATRSMTHPSHSPHPLTLVPYPTYPSKFFFCNACNGFGTGFSYSCSNCEFDLHVHCAYMQTTTTEAPTHGEIINLDDQVEQQPLISYNEEDEKSGTEIIKHFGHPHPMCISEFKKKDSIRCSCCVKAVLGSAYRCLNTKCDFYLHESCFGLPREMRHESHHKHNLTLLSSPAYKEYGDYTCNACFKKGTGFVYHCKICSFDLHVSCAYLPKTAKRPDDEHPLVLFYISPLEKGEEEDDGLTFTCLVCNRSVDNRCWVYYCKICDFASHLECVGYARVKEGKCHDDTHAESVGDARQRDQISRLGSAIETQQKMHLLQLQTQMTRQNAQMMMQMNRQNAQAMASALQSTLNLF